MERFTRGWNGFKSARLTKASSFGGLLSIACGILIILLLAPTPLRAQVGTADILGTVKDQTGAVVVKANVTVKNLSTSEARAVTTDDRGDYIFNLLPNGQYFLQVEAPGFKAFSVAKVTLSAGDRLRVDAQLAPGSVTERVEVGAAAPVLQTDNSTVGNMVDDKTVQDLPLNGRNFAAAIEIMPGVNAGYSGNNGRAFLASSGTSVFDRRVGDVIVANGQTDAFNDELIDGFDNNERGQGIVAVRPSLDGIAEMRVDTSDYRAEYGRTAGAVVNIITKSGTNEFHGSAYEYFRNDALDSRDFFATGTKPEYRMNEFGGSIGGPIIKNKTTFFADVEEDRIIQGFPYLTTVPTAFERADIGNFTDVGGPDVSGVPLDPVAVEFFKMYPAPTSSALYNNYTSAPNKTQFGTTLDGRVDHRFSPNNLSFARYAYNPVSTWVPPAFPKDPTTGIYPGGPSLTFSGPNSTAAQNLQFDYVHIFNPRLLLDLKAAWTRVNVVSLPINYGQGDNAKLGIPNVYIPGLPDTDELPEISTPSFSLGQLGSSSTIPLFDINNSFQYSGSLIYSRGSHNIKVGGGLIRRQVDNFQDILPSTIFVFVGAPPYFNDRANFLTGNVVVEFRQEQMGGTADYRTWEPDFYVQDDWHLIPKLTLNLGVRYDIFTPFTEVLGRQSNFDVGSVSSGVGPQNFILGTQNATMGISTDYHDVAPRVGFAYTITPKTVLRGGFAMSYFPPDAGNTPFVGANPPAPVMLAFNPPDFYSYFAGPGDFQLSAGPPVPSVVSPIGYQNNSGLTAVTAKARNLRASYVEQFNLFLQREFGANTLSLGYVGVLGQAMMRSVNWDQPAVPCMADPTGDACGIGKTTAQLATLPTPAFVYATQLPYINTIVGNYNGSSTNYHAMQLIFARHFTGGFTANANYTWSHGFDNNEWSTVTASPKYDYGNSSLDVRQRVAVNAGYALPFAKNAKGFNGAALKGWQANTIFYWQTGVPYTVYSETSAPNRSLYTNLPGLSQERINVVGSPVLKNPSIYGWFNVDAFTPQTQGTIGNEGVNQYSGPRDRRADLSLIKDSALTERWKLQFRAECFNISNTPNFSTPDTLSGGYVTGPNGNLVPAGPVQGSSFGTILSTAGGEVPRQFQFALKLLF